MAGATKYIEWYVKKCLFEFADSESYENWKKNPKVYFEFSPTNSSDKGAAVLNSPTDKFTTMEITADNAAISIFEDDGGPCISASVFFPLDGDKNVVIDFREDIDAEALRDWQNDNGGYYCGNLDLCVDDADTVKDEGGGWRITTSDELDRYAKFIDSKGTEPF